MKQDDKVKRYVPVLHLNEHQNLTAKMEELTEHQTAFPDYRNGIDYEKIILQLANANHHLVASLDYGERKDKTIEDNRVKLCDLEIERTELMKIIRSMTVHPAGSWMSAALEDPNTCDECKRDFQRWFDD